MEDRHEDLYLLDAEQAARELLLYGQGRSEAQVEQLVATAKYLSALLRSLDRHDLAQVADTLSRSLPAFDEGKGRRAIREMGEIVLAEAEHLRRAGGGLSGELSPSPDRLERLAARLEEGVHTPTLSPSSPIAPTIGDQVPGLRVNPVLRGPAQQTPRTPQGGDLIANAFKAIQAVDSLAAMISLSVAPGGSTEPRGSVRPGTQDQGSTAGRAGEDGLLSEPVIDTGKSLPEVEPPVNPIAGTWARGRPEPDTSPLAAAGKIVPPEPAVEPTAGAGASMAPTVTTAPGEEPAQTYPPDGSSAAPLAEPARKTARRRRTPVMREAAVSPGAPAQRVAGSEGRPASESTEAFHPSTVTTADVDRAFLLALRLIQDEPWSAPALSLLEAIDQIDHVSLASVLPPEVRLLGGQAPRVHRELAAALGLELARCGIAGVVEATLISHTLFFAIHLDRTIPASALAGLVGTYGGRLEADDANRRWQLVVPSSARLIRVIPLRSEDAWIAVPWAHFLGVDGPSYSQDARLQIGDEQERIRVTELGAATLALRYELGRHLRRRDRYRGVVATAAAEILPLFG